MTAATPALAAASGRSAIATAYALFVRRELFTRRSLLLTLVCLLPAVVAGTARAFGKGGYGFFEQTAGGIYLTVLSVVVPVFHAVAAFHEEFEQRTIVYLLTRPPTRAAYVVSKFLAAWTCSALSLVVGIAATAIVCSAGTTGAGSTWMSTAAKLATTTVLASGAYTAFFLMFGLTFKNPVLWALAVTFGWEQAAGLLPSSLQSWTLGVYARWLFVQWADAEPDLFALHGRARLPGGGIAAELARAASEAPAPPPPSILMCLTVLAGVTVVSLALGAILFRNREEA